LFDFHIFSLFVVFDHDIIMYIEFTHIADLNTATDGVTN